MSILNQDRIVEMGDIKLDSGSHTKSEKQFCAMELVAYIAGEPHSDHPQCACPAITAYVVHLNDGFSDKERQLLKPYLERIVGTNDVNSRQRAKILAHTALTMFAPMVLDSEGFKDHADKLRGVKFGDWEKGENLARAAYVDTERQSSNVLFWVVRASEGADSGSVGNVGASAGRSLLSALRTNRKVAVGKALECLDEVLKVGRE